MRWESILFAPLAWSALGCSKSASAESTADGAALFATMCARCHGTEGKGGPPAAPSQPGPRNLTDPAFQAARTDAELRAVISGGKGGVMPAFGSVYKPAEIDALVAHVRRLGGR